MKTATDIQTTQTATVICPHCGVENFFNHQKHRRLFVYGGTVECDNWLDCGESFNVPTLNKQAVK